MKLIGKLAPPTWQEVILTFVLSLAATLVLLIISRLMIDWSAALEELFQILYGFLLLICLFWLFFSLFLTVKYGWIYRKK